MAATVLRSVNTVMIIVYSILTTTNLGCANKILMNALLGEGSHFLCAASVGERLVQRGHNVTFLISNAYSHRATDPKFADHFDFEIFRHPIPVDDVHAQLEAFNTRAFMPASSQLWSIVEILRDGRAADCDALLGDDETMGRLARANYSMIVYDFGWPCPILIARRLGIPHSAISPVSCPCTVTADSGSVMEPGYVPEIMTGFSNRMNFKERVENFLIKIFLKLYGLYYYEPYERIKSKYNIEPDMSIPRLIGSNELFLTNTDFAVEFPCALAPSVIPVGGLTTRPADPLPDDLELFMQSSGDHGVVVCSMGTYFTSVPLQVVNNFLHAFSRLPQKVIFQLRSVPPGITVPSNVLTLPWLPQNNLLGHAKTRAFLYQGGNNGFYEALYHAVPIVVIPIHGDQYDTGAKVSSHGLGITINKMTLTADRIYDAVHEVIVNASYAITSQRLSKMFRDRPMSPAETAAFWIDHVIKHGGAQYKMPYVEMGEIQRNLMDVYLFLILCLILVVFIVWKICRLVLTSLRYFLQRMTTKEKLH